MGGGALRAALAQLGPGQSFQLIQALQRVLAAVAAHLGAGLQAGTARWSLGLSKRLAAQLRVELDAGHARGIPLGHAPDGRADRGSDAAGRAALAAAHQWRSGSNGSAARTALSGIAANRCG